MITSNTITDEVGIWIFHDGCRSVPHQSSFVRITDVVESWQWLELIAQHKKTWFFLKLKLEAKRYLPEMNVHM